MNQVDIIALVVCLPLAVRGYSRGFLREAFALAGLLAGIVVAAAANRLVGAELARREVVSPLMSETVAAVLLFAGVWLAGGIAGAVARRVARAVLLGGVDRLAGIALGMAQGATLVGLALALVSRLFPQPEVLRPIEASVLARPLMRFATTVVESGRRLAPPEVAGQPA